MNPTDIQLLKQYAETGDQQAFAQVVEHLIPELRDLVPKDDPTNTTTYHYPSSR